MNAKLAAVAAGGLTAAAVLLAPIPASATPVGELAPAHGTSIVCECPGPASAVRHEPLQQRKLAAQVLNDVTAHASPHVFVHHMGHHHK